MGIMTTTVKVASGLMSNYWLHLGYFQTQWLILELGETVWLSYFPFLGWKCPLRCLLPQERAKCGFRVAPSVPSCCSHQHLSLPKGICPSGWRTPSCSELPCRSRWAEVRLGRLLCSSPYGFSLIYTRAVYGISRIQMQAFWKRWQHGFASPFSSPFLMLYCLCTASSLFLNLALTLYSSYNFLQRLHFSHPDVSHTGDLSSPSS